MFTPIWVRYTGENLGNAVKISENSDKAVVLLARSKVEGDKGSVLLYGDFAVGETCATVCTVDRVFQVEEFELLMAPEGYFQWVKCLCGYVPKFAVCAGSSLIDQEPFFAGRAKVSGDFRGGSIVPSHGECFFPTNRTPVASDVMVFDDEADEKTAVYGDHIYEVLQVAPNQWTNKNVLASFVLETMGEEKVLGELAQLFQQHFHGRSQVEFHDAISKLWAKSGLDADFFFPQALPWLLDLARIHGLPNCFRQCLLRSLLTRKLKTEKELCEGIKLARLFKHTAMNGFHEKAGQMGRRNGAIIRFVGLEPSENHFDRLKKEWDQRGKAKQRLFTVFMQMISDHHVAPVDAGETGIEKIMSKDERQMEKIKRQSLLPQSRTPVPHSIMIQRQEGDADVGIRLEIEDDQMVLEFEVPPTLSQSDLQRYEEQVRDYVQSAGCSAQIAAVMKTLLAACQRQQKMTETGRPTVDSQHEENHHVTGSQVRVDALHKIFSTPLTSKVSYTSDLTKFLYPLLDQYVVNELGGTLTPKEMLDLLNSEELRPQVPGEMKTLLAKSFVLSLYNHSEDTVVFSQMEDRVFDFLVAHATSNSSGGNTNLLLSLTSILTHSSTSPGQLGPTIFSTLVQFLKNIDEEKFLQNDSLVVCILRLIRDKCKCRTYSADTIEIMNGQIPWPGLK